MTAAAPTRTSVLERVCAGASRPGCGRTYARVEVPWSGSRVLVSHGVCEACFHREEGMMLRDTQGYLDRQVGLPADGLEGAAGDEGLPIAPSGPQSFWWGVVKTVGIISWVVCAGVAFRALLAAW